jgi:hypothetical protein
MEMLMRKAMRIAAAAVVAAVMIFFGYVVSHAGYQILREWRSIGAAYAACGVLWILAGPAMLVAGLWVLASLGRHRIPLWLGGTAAVAAGAVLVAGVLTHVVPCSGPS